MKNDISKLEASRRCSICTQAWRPIGHGCTLRIVPRESEEEPNALARCLIHVASCAASAPLTPGPNRASRPQRPKWRLHA